MSSTRELKTVKNFIQHCFKPIQTGGGGGGIWGAFKAPLAKKLNNFKTV